MKKIKHEEKLCPRCEEKFECKVGSILLCQCSQISLSDNEIDYIKSKYADCLCINCIRFLKEEYENKNK